MSRIVNPVKNVTCYTEYGKLLKVILCPPKFLKIREVINFTQEQFVADNIDTERAVQQFNNFKQELNSRHIEVITLPSVDYPEQVFTRDIGFTLGETIFIAEMNRSIRQGEEELLIQWLNDQHITYDLITEGSIEGGDVLIDRDTVWVGDSGRTSTKAIKELQRKLPEFQVLPISIAPEYLHLDCVFNIISATEALIFPPAIQQQDIDRFASRYELIEVSEEEQFTLGTNILSLGHKTVVSLPFNYGVNKQLKKRDYKVIEVDISEIIKSGGSFRCITMPLLRE